jgi:hypothetical protein
MVLEFLSCVTPPLIEQLHVSQQQFQLLSVMNPDVVTHELLTHYAAGHHNDLARLLYSVRCISTDLTEVHFRTPEFCQEIQARIVSYADSLQKVVCRIRFTCYLFWQLPEDTLDQVAVQDQQCSLDILWHQLDGLSRTVSTYSTTTGGFPNRWFAALAATIGQLAKQVDKWGSQLRIDLAHLDQPDTTASVTQDSPIATQTRSHYFDSPFYRPWKSR